MSKRTFEHLFAGSAPLTLSNYGRNIRVSSRSGVSSRSAGRAVKGSYVAAKGAAKTYRARASPAFKRAVKAVIAQQKEQKLDVTNLYSGGVTTLLATNELSAPVFNPMAPFLAVGAADGQRVASDIRLVKSYVKFQLTLNQEASGDHGPFIATVWIGKVRGLGSAVPNAADFASLLTTQTANVYTAATTTVPITGMYPVNDDLWDIKVRKDYKLGKAGTLNATSNDFNLSYNDEIEITKMFPAVLRYDGSNGNPASDNLWMFITYRTLNGAVVTSGLPQVVATTVHRYTDA